MRATQAHFAPDPMRLFQGVPLAPLLAEVLEALLAISALIAGAMMVLRPDGAWLGFPPGVLVRTPFETFLLPGLLLALGVGGPNLIAMVVTVRESRWARAATFVAGASAVIFAAVETAMIPFSALQPAVMAIGGLLIALAVAPARRA